MELALLVIAQLPLHVVDFIAPMEAVLPLQIIALVTMDVLEIL